MNRPININEVRAFLTAANKQFEEGGIFIERISLKRDENGVLTGINVTYENRNKSEE